MRTNIQNIWQNMNTNTIIIPTGMPVVPTIVVCMNQDEQHRDIEGRP